MHNSWKIGTASLLAAWLLSACGGGGTGEILVGGDNNGGNLPLTKPPAEQFTDNSPPTDGPQASWLKDAYHTLPPTGDADGAYQNTSLRAWADEVLRLTNIERQKNGLAPLQRSSQMDYVAQAHARDMGLRDYFSHDAQGYGLDPFERMDAAGSPAYGTAGENIAAGWPGPAVVMSTWMNSSGHRANILNPAFTHIGIGVFYDSGGGRYPDYWVQLFASYGSNPDAADWVQP